MIREEEILNAAREYNNGITLSSPSNVLHFEAGAKWADETPIYQHFGMMQVKNQKKKSLFYLK